MLLCTECPCIPMHWPIECTSVETRGHWNTKCMAAKCKCCELLWHDKNIYFPLQLTTAVACYKYLHQCCLLNSVLVLCVEISRDICSVVQFHTYISAPYYIFLSTLLCLHGCPAAEFNIWGKGSFSTDRIWFNSNIRRTLGSVLRKIGFNSRLRICQLE